MIQFITTNWHIIVAGVLGLYETIARLVPTAGSWSIVTKVINVLKWLSDNLDNVKK